MGYIKDLLKALGCLFGGILLLLIVALWLLQSELEKDWRKEQKELEEEDLEQLMVIPSNGNGELYIEHKYTEYNTFNNKGSICIYRDTILSFQYDYHYVYNYNRADSLFMFSYIDSLTFDKSNDIHKHIFYLYDSILPQKYPFLTLKDDSCRRWAYWSLVYDKKQVNGACWEAYAYTRYYYPGEGSHYSSMGDIYHFVYDKQKRKFRLSTSYKQAICHSTDGTEIKYNLYD